MENKGTNTNAGTQDSNFAGSNMGESPALARLKANVQAPPVQPVNPNPTPVQQDITQPQLSARTQVETSDIFSQISNAVEPGLFDQNIVMENVPSSNEANDYVQQPQVQPIQQPQQLIVTQPLPNPVEINTPPTQPLPQQQAIDPNPLRQPVDPNEQRYADSSREAKRLALENAKLKQQVDSIAPVMPLVLKLKESESLRNMVNGFYQKGNVAPQDVKKLLKLPDDFVFDGDDAFNNPESPSAKVLATTIDMAASARAEKIRTDIMADLQTKQDDVIRSNERQQFQMKNQLTQDQMSEMDTFMKTHNVSLDDIWYLMNKGSREQNIAQSVQQDVINQMHSVREVMPPTMNGASAIPTELNPDDALFKSAFGNAENEKGYFDVNMPPA